MMRRHSLLGTTVLTATALLATSAKAEITGADVWANYTSFYEATGAQVIGEQQADGDTLVISDHALLYRLPFNIATMRLGLPDMTLVTQSDGTVTMTLPDTFDVTFEIDIPDEASVSGALEITQTDYTGTASGTPGDVTYNQSASAVKLQLKDLTISGENVDLLMLMEFEGYDAASQVVEGDLIAVTSQVTLEPADIAYVFNDDGGVVVSNTGTFGQLESTTEMALPAGGSNLFDLSTVLRNGAFLRGTSTGSGSSGETITTVNGDVISEQSTSSGPTSGTFAIDASGVETLIDASDNTFLMSIPEAFPFPLEGSIGQAVIGYKFPLLPSEEEQDVALRFDVRDLVMSDDLWALFDPEQELPRDPATLNLDLAATVLSDIDWLNFATLEAQLDQPVPPISPTSVTINQLMIAAVGASAQGSGRFTLDMSDMETIPGVPRPEGSALLEVEGANGLIDRLVSLGVIGPEEAGMARLGMGFIARSTGDDAFQTEVEVNPEGHVMVNGQRMR